MTILAGMFSRDRDPELSEVQVDAVRRALSRGGDAAITEFRDRRAFLAKVDIGAYGDAAFRIAPSGSVMMAAGHPLLSEAAGRGRSHRSEEHTSELQSRLHLVCRLLLEKKKQHS